MSRKGATGSTGGAQAGQAGLGDDLGALLQAEQQLSDLLEAARDRARRLVEEAQAEVLETERRLAADLEVACGELQVRLLDRREADLRQVRLAYADEAGRFHDVPDEVVRNLAAAVVETLIVGERP